MRAFAARIALVSSQGKHLRYLPSELAEAMVRGGAAAIADGNGKVKSITLLRTSQVYAERIGDAGEPRLGVRFHRWVRLECGAIIVEFHPRSMWTLEPE